MIKKLCIVLITSIIFTGVAFSLNENEIIMKYDVIVLVTYSKKKGSNDIVAFKIIKNAKGEDEERIRKSIGKRRERLLPSSHHTKLWCYTVQVRATRSASYWVREGRFFADDDELLLEELLRIAKPK